MEQVKHFRPGIRSAYLAVQQLLMGLVVGASAAGTVSAVIAASLPRSSTAWLLGYRAALRDHAEQADPRRHLRRVD